MKQKKTKKIQGIPVISSVSSSSCLLLYWLLASLFLSLPLGSLLPWSLPVAFPQPPLFLSLSPYSSHSLGSLPSWPLPVAFPLQTLVSSFFLISPHCPLGSLFIKLSVWLTSTFFFIEESIEFVTDYYYFCFSTKNHPSFLGLNTTKD